MSESTNDTLFVKDGPFPLYSGLEGEVQDGYSDDFSFEAALLNATRGLASRLQLPADSVVQVHVIGIAAVLYGSDGRRRLWVRVRQAT